MINCFVRNLSSSTKNIPIRVTLYTKNNCSLCDKVKEFLAVSKFKDQVQLEEVDIEAPANAAWQQKYRYEIPVVYIDGRPAVRGRIAQQILERKLEEAQLRNERKK